MFTNTDSLLDKVVHWGENQSSDNHPKNCEIEPDFNCTATEHRTHLQNSLMSTHMAMAHYNKPELNASHIFALTSADLKQFFKRDHLAMPYNEGERRTCL